MTFVWFLIFIILLIIEFITPNLVSIWFAFGALISIIVSLFEESFYILFFIFLVSSIVFLFLFKKILKNKKFTKVTPTNVDRLVGKSAVVVKDILNNKCGEVEIFGDVWTAKSDDEIKEGCKVIIKDIEGVKLIVCKKEEN